MAEFEHLLRSYDVGDTLDDIASSDPPAYLRRCFAEGISTPSLSLARVQQLAVCGMVLDSILNDRGYPGVEPELISDWRTHYTAKCVLMKETAVTALQRAVVQLQPTDAEAAGELDALEHRLAGG